MTVSFIHGGDASMASYRYRCAIPANAIGAAINDSEASVLIFAKPHPYDVQTAMRAKGRGGTVIVDICDAHLRAPCYQRLIELADAVTAPTDWLARLIEEDFGVSVQVIHDPYEFDERPPHVSGDRLLWFGHATNYYSLERFLPSLTSYNLTIMSNVEGSIPWSVEGLKAELARADIVLLPETAPYKSANRAVEAIRSGCFVVAEPHPSLEGMPGIWVGNLMEGITWAIQHPAEANERTQQAQNYVRLKYAPKTQGYVWRSLLSRVNSASTSEAESCTGLDGPTSTDSTPMPMSSAT